MQAILTTLLPVLFIGGNWWFWSGVMMRWQTPYRERVARRFRVTIDIGPRGHWQVAAASTDRPWWQRIGIELLQLGFFLGAMIVWGLALGAMLVVMHLAGPGAWR